MTDHNQGVSSPDQDPYARGRILVVALLGWNDAGDAASSAVKALRDAVGAERVVEDIDDEDFFDYSIHRPIMRAGGDGERGIEWPSVSFLAPEARDSQAEEASELAADAGLTVSGSNRENVFVLVGPEPTLRWRRFTERVMELCDAEQITRVVLVGALLADVPHSRPITIFMSSDHDAVREEFDISRSEYEGPTGVLSSIGQAAGASGRKVLSLWASVPHYAHQSPSPKATLALIDRLTEIVDVSIPHGTLIAESAEWEAEVSEAAAQDDEIAQYVGYLERTRDMVEAPEASGEAIAQEFERFLRQTASRKPQPGAGQFPTDLPGTAQRPAGADRSEDGGADEQADDQDDLPAGGEETPPTQG